MGSRQRIVIVDNHDLARGGARRLLRGAPGLELVGEAASGQAALAMCERQQPDLVIMDLHLGDIDGLTVIRELRRRLPSIRVLVFSMFDAHEYLVRAVDAGASEYVLKGGTRRELLAAIQRTLGRAGRRARKPRAIAAPQLIRSIP